MFWHRYRPRTRAQASTYPTFSEAYAAYSMRVPFGSLYSGPLIRVRRSSDNAELNINAASTPDANGNRFLDTAALLAHIGAGSGFVTIWYNQSSAGRHATQATAAKQPRIVNAGVVDTVGGKPTLVFNGTTQFLITNFTINRSAFPNVAISAVYRNSVKTGSGALWGADNGDWDRFQLLNFAINPTLANNIANGTLAVLQSALASIQFLVYRAVLATGVTNGSNVFVNGVAGTQFTESLGNAGTLLEIGAINPFGDYPFLGEISEFVVHQSIGISIERNQGAAFGIAVA